MSAKPKQRTIRAWAVVCASGKFHREEHKTFRLYVDPAVAEYWMQSNDDFRGCGPHTVVPLTGTFQPARAKAKR